MVADKNYTHEYIASTTTILEIKEETIYLLICPVGWHVIKIA